MICLEMIIFLSSKRRRVGTYGKNGATLARQHCLDFNDEQEAQLLLGDRATRKPAKDC